MSIEYDEDFSDYSPPRTPEEWVSYLEAEAEARQVPVRHRTAWFRQHLTKEAEWKFLSPSERVKLKCMDCVGFENASNRIHYCTVYVCPLWPIRPYQIQASKREKR